jgi:hypothetical protein
VNPIEEMLRVRVEVELELTHRVPTIGQKRDLLVHVMALRLKHLEQAPLGLRIQGLDKPKALAGRDIRLILSAKGQEALADDDFEVTLLLVLIAHISTIDAHLDWPIGNR